jgi:hypothetical protein
MKIPDLSDKKGWDDYIEAKLRPNKITAEKPWKKDLDRIFERYNKLTTPDILLSCSSENSVFAKKTPKDSD